MPVPAAMAVPAMHEEMHERAGEDEQPGQHAEDVGTVLGQQEERDQCREQRQAGALHALA